MFFTDPATTHIYTLSLHDALPIWAVAPIVYTEKMSCPLLGIFGNDDKNPNRDQVNRTEAELKKYGKSYEFHRYDGARSEEHTSELQSRLHLVCRLLLEKKK